MNRSVPLDNVTHRALRVHTGRSARFGDARQSALALPAEFRELQAHYPIVFQSVDGEPGFQPIALFGLEPEQNLFLHGEAWDAPLLPLSMMREPFLIGRHAQGLGVHVNLEHPRIVRPEEGEIGLAVFLPHGGPSEFLDTQVGLLERLHAEVQQLPGFIEALCHHQLLEGFVLDVELADGSQGRLSGLHTIHEERLAALPGSALEALQRQGYLLPIYMQLASLARLRDLVERRNRLQQALD